MFARHVLAPSAESGAAAAAGDPVALIREVGPPHSADDWVFVPAVGNLTALPRAPPASGRPRSMKRKASPCGHHNASKPAVAGIPLRALDDGESPAGNGRGLATPSAIRSNTSRRDRRLRPACECNGAAGRPGSLAAQVPTRFNRGGLYDRLSRAVDGAFPIRSDWRTSSGLRRPSATRRGQSPERVPRLTRLRTEGRGVSHQGPTDPRLHKRTVNRCGSATSSGSVPLWASIPGIIFFETPMP